MRHRSKKRHDSTLTTRVWGETDPSLTIGVAVGSGPGSGNGKTPGSFMFQEVGYPSIAPATRTRPNRRDAVDRRDGRRSRPAFEPHGRDREAGGRTPENEHGRTWNLID